MANKKPKQNKPKTGLARCLELASNKKGLVFLSAILSSLAAIASFVPYIAVYFIISSPIIVLDEATAFSDPENEYLIQKAFEKLMQDKTVIMIAHRLSTIRNANKIIVMENGRLIESGKHNDLIQKNGRYAEMWKHYTEAIDWKVQTKVVQ